MIRNYYTLAKLTTELQLLCGLKIVECFTQDKNTLLLSLYDGNELFYLNINTDSRFASMYLRHNFHRARKNTIDLFDSLLGQIVKAISISENDRIITVSTNDYSMHIHLFGGPRSNVIITNAKGVVIDSFKSSVKLKGKPYQFNPNTQKAKEDNISLMNFLIKGDYNFGKFYAREFIKRNNLNNNIPYTRTQELIDKIEKFKKELLSGKKYYLLQDKQGNLVFSLIKLTDFQVLETYDSVSKVIERRIRKELIEGNVERERKALLRKLERKKSKTERTINEISDIQKNSERAEKYRHYAELLMQQPGQKTKPGEKISVIDYAGNTIEIKLDAKKTINENAQYYFAKAKNTETNIKIKQNMLPGLKEKLDVIVQIINEIKEVESVKRLKKIKEENESVFGSDADAPEGGGKYSRFDLGEGYILFVGKNAANNDDLTMHFAKPNDLWFHARGTSGSHAVLRMGKESKPPKYILKKAASIAAYYSGAKNAKYVPVSYTFKKYVHKPKGSNPGSVVIKREEVIMVEPELPPTD